jgi:hypothetical protein
MAVAAVASAAMALALTRDATYALQSTSVSDLGDLTATPASALVSNELVHGRGRLAGAGALRYERPFESDSYRIAPVAGRPDVWVELRVPAGEESNRFVPKTDFVGRMVKFSSTGLRHRGLRSAIEDRTGQKVGSDAYLVVDGQTPEGARAYALLWLMFVSFAVWNVVAIARLVRKVK